MPPPEIFERHQYAVLWEVASYDDYGRQRVYEPVELRVRWNTTRRQGTRPDGTPVNLTALVVVNATVPIGSLLWLGRLSEWYGTGSAGNDSELVEVVGFRNTPDLKNRYRRRELDCTRWQDELPTQV